MIIMGRRLRRLAVGLTTVAAVLAAGAAPADSQVTPEPPVVDPAEVSIVGSESFAAIYRDCDGTEIGAFTYGFVEFERTGGVDEELEVPVTYSGSLASSLTFADDVAFFEEGFDFGEIFFELSDTTPGDLTITIDPPAVGAGYVEGDPSSITLQVPDEQDVLDCNAPLPIDDDEATQTIEVGEQPDPFGVFEGSFGFSEEDIPDDELEFFLEGFTTPVVGALPPGLAYDDDRWSGAATTPGPYSFGVRLCFENDFTDEGTGAEDEAVDGPPDDMRAQRGMARAISDLPDTLCLGTADVEIVVEPASTTAPPVPAPPAPASPVTPDPAPTASPATASPATPITGAARFTG